MTCVVLQDVCPSSELHEDDEDDGHGGGSSAAGESGGEIAKIKQRRKGTWNCVVCTEMCHVFLHFPCIFRRALLSLRHVAAQTISSLLAAAGIGDTAKVQAITSLKEANINSSECKHLVSCVHVICAQFLAAKPLLCG